MKRLPEFNPQSAKRLLAALVVDKVMELRQLGMSDRAIARKLGVPRWMVRVVS